jgi:hypothetical protein
VTATTDRQVAPDCDHHKGAVKRTVGSSLYETVVEPRRKLHSV